MGMSPGAKTKSDTKEHAVTQANTPAFAQPAVSGYYGQVGALGEKLGANPSLFTTPANDLQTQAGQGAAGLGGWQAGIDNSNSLANDAASTSFDPAAATHADAVKLGPASTTSAAQLFDVPLDRYLNPATKAVVDTTLAGFDDNAGRQTAAFEAAQARSGAFGGSRGGIASAQLADDQGRTRAATEAGLRSSAFDRATGLAQVDAGNRQQANLFNTDAANRFALTQGGYDQSTNLFNAGADNDMTRFNSTLDQQEAANKLAAAGIIGDNAVNEGAGARADIGTQLDAGNTLFQVDKANNLAPLTGLGAYGELIDPALLQAISGQTIDSTGTSTTKQSGGLLQSLLAAGAQIGGAAISDRRMKQNIQQIGALPDGLGVYSYSYLWDGEDTGGRVGVMADDVARLRPWALGPVVDGISTVDYSKLEAA